jgi:prepilin-type processing-associated H-X9-DG protein/prepilin-type N-terminal cleavage/methylation domain-containing protein
MLSPRDPRVRSGFTLIEILIVVTLGIVLAGVAFSAGKSMQVKSRQATSSNNLRQWGTALALYSGEHNGTLPRRGQGRQKLAQIERPEDWFNALPPYLGQPAYQELVATGKIPRTGDDSVFICPGVKPTAQAARYSLGYGMNMNLSPWNFPSATLLSQISSPTTVVFMAESPGDYSSIYPSASGYSLIAPHGGMGNILFLDGHVEAYTADYLGCKKGDPGRHDVSWKTGTDSDANSDSY